MCHIREDLDDCDRTEPSVPSVRHRSEPPQNSMAAVPQDDHATVRHAALETLVAILPDLPSDARSTCLPPVRTVFSKPPPDATADPAAAAALAGAFAAPTPLPTALLPLVHTDCAMFLGCFCHLALRGPPAVRLQCARGFPAMLLAMCPEGSTALQRAPLLDTLLRLSADTMVCPCASTR